MDPFVALLLFPFVFFGSSLGFRLVVDFVRRHWDNTDRNFRVTIAEAEAESLKRILRERVESIEKMGRELIAAQDRITANRDGLTALEQQVASIKSQLSLSSTIRR